MWCNWNDKYEGNIKLKVLIYKIMLNKRWVESNYNTYTIDLRKDIIKCFIHDWIKTNFVLSLNKFFSTSNSVGRPLFNKFILS